MTQSILNYNIERRSVGETVVEIGEAISVEKHDGRWLACINPHSYVVATKDAVFMRALKSADWLIPDGAGIVIAGRILRRPVHERITGADIFEGVMTHMDNTKGRVFFLGGTEKTLGLIRKKLLVDYPGIHLVGTYSPPFKATYSEVEMDEMIRLVNAAKADVLWVGMTAPKQEKWIYENRNRIKVPFTGAIGAVFDFYTGQVKRSPEFFRASGFEWLPRLVQQPKRLWKRMLISAPIFMFDVLREKLGILKPR